VKWWGLIQILSLTIFVCAHDRAYAQDDALTERQEVLRIYQRIAGKPPARAQMAELLGFYRNQRPDLIILRATQDLNFYQSTLRTMFMRLAGEGDDLQERVLDEVVATMVGLVRDNYAFNQILYDDVVYTARDQDVDVGSRALAEDIWYFSHTAGQAWGRAAPPPLTTTSGAQAPINIARWNRNNHHSDLERLFPYDWSQRLVRRTQTEAYTRMLSVAVTSNNFFVNRRLHSEDIGGVFSMRTPGKLYFEGGTNRRVIKHVFENYLCLPLDNLRNSNLSQAYIRQDIDRASQNFAAECASCHSGIDGLANAFNFFDVRGPNGEHEFLYTRDVSKTGRTSNNIASIPKLFRAEAFPDGFNPRTMPLEEQNRWWNVWASQSIVGWRIPPGMSSYESGKGARELGKVFAYTEAFTNCMARRSFEQVCGRAPTTTEAAQLASIARNVEQGVPEYAAYQASSAYNLRALFAKAGDLCF
jgi:hypothetical protein